jgi:hypothetical protein
MDIIVLICWSIWSVRNNLIFRGEVDSLEIYKHYYKEVFGLVILRAKKALSSYSFMARVVCVICLIFFLFFFVS